MTAVQRTSHLLGAVAATLLLLGAARALGPAGVLVNILVPVPAAFVHMRLGTAVGAAVIGSAAGTLYLSGGAGVAVAYLMQFGLASLVLPLLLRRGWPWDRAVAGSLVVVLGIAFAGLGSYAAARDTKINDLVAGYVHNEVETALAIYEEADLPAEQLVELRGVAEQMGEFMLGTWPALAIVATGMVLMLMVFLLTAISGGRYRIPGPSFRRWKTPEVMVWGLILAGFGAFFGPDVVQSTALNLLTVLLPLYFLHGMAIVAFFFEKKSLAPFLRALGYLLAAVLNPLPMVVTALGVFDLWIDFRKPRIKKAT